MEDAADDPWNAVFGALASLRDRWPAPVSAWSYDRRLKCVTSSLPMTEAPGAEVAICLAMPRFWDASSLSRAPLAARSTAEACGGLRASQRIYWGRDGEGGGSFGLWWPWGDGATVSLRIGLHGVDVPKERYPRLRDVFGIPQAAP